MSRKVILLLVACILVCQALIHRIKPTQPFSRSLGSITKTSLGIGSFQYDQVTADTKNKNGNIFQRKFPFLTKLNAFANGLKYFDSDKESNRKFRRTVFNKHDWKKHRSGNRYFTELLSMPRSVVLRGLTVQALTVTMFSAFICIYNLLVEFR